MTNRFIFHFSLLIFAALFWGLGFIGTKWTLVEYTPSWSNALRYVFASILVMPYLLYQKSLTKGWAFLRPPMLAGLFLFGGFHFQTLGLAYTSAGKSGFITALYALFAPLLEILIFKQRYKYQFWFLVTLSFIGIFLLCDPRVEGFNKGDFYTLLSAIMFAVHIIYISRITHNYKSLELNFLQGFGIMIYAIPLALIMDGTVNLNPIFADPFEFGSIFMGFFSVCVLSSIIAFTIQVYSQRFVPSHIVGLVMLTEAFFAALFGYLILSERLTTVNLIGGLCLMTSVALIPLTEKSNRS